MQIHIHRRHRCRTKHSRNRYGHAHYDSVSSGSLQQQKISTHCGQAKQTNTVSGQAPENQQVYMWQKICLRYFKICLRYFKICLRYFKISQTYFRLSPLYFQFTAGSFLPYEKNIFFRGELFITLRQHTEKYAYGHFRQQYISPFYTSVRRKAIYIGNVSRESFLPIL